MDLPYHLPKPGFKDKNKLFIAVILVIVKTILLPVVAYGVTLALCSGENEAQKQDLAGFAFLVGALPTAPTAYVFASKYNINPDMIAGAMVACTIISAPLIYGSGNYDCKFCPLYIQLNFFYLFCICIRKYENGTFPISNCGMLKL